VTGAGISEDLADLTAQAVTTGFASATFTPLEAVAAVRAL
jgi:hypothetical protein